MSDFPVMIVDPEANDARVAKSAAEAKPGEVVLARGKTLAARVADLEAQVSMQSRMLQTILQKQGGTP